jgi:hypothetical protein
MSFMRETRIIRFSQRLTQHGAAALTRGRACLFRLCRTPACCCIPILTAILIAELLFWTAGDSWPLRKVIAVQEASGSEVIFSRAHFASQPALYKTEAIRRYQPAILAVGSARIDQIRASMFYPVEELFYNGAGLLESAEDLSRLATDITEGALPAPAVVIVGIDPWWLLAERGGPQRATIDAAFDPAAHVRAFVGLLSRVLHCGARKKSATLPTQYRAIGADAHRQGRGFRRDGSYRRGPALHSAHAANRDSSGTPRIPIHQRIARLQRDVAPAAPADTVRVRLIVEALCTLRGAGIEVYVVMTPFSSAVWEALDGSDVRAGWWELYRGGLVAILGQCDIPAIPIASPARYGLNDSYMLDDWRPGEVFMGHIVRALIQGAPRDGFLEYVDKQALLRRVLEARSPLVLAPPSPRGAPARGAGKIAR